MAKQTKDNSKKDLYKVNKQIRAPYVRLVGNNIESGVVELQEALSIADELNLDLIEFSPSANPPVCKIEDYAKFLYNLKKKEKDNEKRNKSNNVELKEMRFGPNTDEHDFNFKKNHVINFLKAGDRVKTYVYFKGREIQHKEKGQIMLLKLGDEISDVGVVEKLPVLEGNRMIMFIRPKK